MKASIIMHAKFHLQTKTFNPTDNAGLSKSYTTAPGLLDRSACQFRGISAHDAQNIAQARLLVNVGNNQVSTLGNILGVNNEQLLMLEKIYKSLGNPQSVNRSDIKANSIIKKNGLSSFLDSAAGSTFSDLDVAAFPKGETFLHK